MGCHFLLQTIFPIQDLTSALLNFRQIPYHLSHHASAKNFHLHRELVGRSDMVLRRHGEKPLTVERGWWAPSLRNAETSLPMSLHRGTGEAPQTAKAEAPTEQSSKIQKCQRWTGRTSEAHLGKWGGLPREHSSFSQLEQFKKSGWERCVSIT